MSRLSGAEASGGRPDGIYIDPSPIATTALQPRDPVLLHQVTDAELDQLGRAHEAETGALAFFTCTLGVASSTVFTALAATGHASAVAWAITFASVLLSAFFGVTWYRARSEWKQLSTQVRSQPKAVRR